ncbi:MAG TPA: 16S rRNA (guanine(527)-N(7))-methyltransferase RsmG [Acetobacteraceae bacterium]|nr:16S rRNA (guanine(527)-N(7))-methyltransferase RsmG [Acetobacteraceae bacterium]
MKRSEVADSVSRETLSRLDCFATLLIRWNPSINLIAKADEGQLWERHIADCVQLAEFLNPRPERGIDLGSGAGFPGLILAIAAGIPFELLEADHRKAAFLREAARETSAPVRVHGKRIEEVGIPPAPLVTARALAPLPKLLRLAFPFLAPGGVCLFMKGRAVETELTDSTCEWHMRVERIKSRTALDGSILRISDLRRVALSD